MHLLEMPNDIILNSQMYTKTTFQPNAYHFFNINSQSNLLDKYLSLGKTSRRSHKESTYTNILQDTTNANMYYFVTSEESSNLFKIYCENGLYIRKNDIVFENVCAKILCQTRDYLVLDILSNTQDSIVRINKETFTFDKCDETISEEEYYKQKYIISSDENYMYFFEIKRTSSVFEYLSIKKYNINANEITEIYTESKISHLAAMSSSITVDNIAYLFGANENSFAFLGYNINYTDDSVVKTIHPISGITYKNVVDKRLYVTLHNIDNNYISCTIHQLENEESGVNAEQYHQHLIFQVNSGKFILKNKVTFTEGCYGILYFSDLYHLIFTANGFNFYEFNPEIVSFEKVYEKTGSFDFIGVDAVKRLYTITNNEIDIISNATICFLESHFEKNEYSYEGTDIETKVFLSAKNFQNNSLHVEVEVHLQGPCYFTDGTQVASVFTELNKDVSLDVIIKGSGKIDLIVKQLGIN
jgi:hypothetical protein